jgi:hypothetical protein
MTGDLNRQWISYQIARSFFVFDPRRMWKRDPDGPSIFQKLDIDCIRMPSRDRDDQ